MRKRDEVDPRAPDRGLGSMLIGALTAIIVLGLIYALGPWSTRTADNTPAGTTVGQGSAPQAKSQQAPASPAPQQTDGKSSN
jgi:hypothetical protein